MMSPESFPGFEPNNLPEFVIPHDGTHPEVSPEEGEIVSQKLSDCLEAMLAQHETMAETLPALPFGGLESTTFLNGKIAIDETSFWKVVVSRNTFLDESAMILSDPGVSLEGVEISRHTESGTRVKEQVIYKLCADGMTRRYNNPVYYMQRGQMGPNDQEVGTAEVDGLVDMLHSPQLVVEAS